MEERHPVRKNFRPTIRVFGKLDSASKKFQPIERVLCSLDFGPWKIQQGRQNRVQIATREEIALRLEASLNRILLQNRSVDRKVRVVTFSWQRATLKWPNHYCLLCSETRLPPLNGNRLEVNGSDRRFNNVMVQDV